VGEMTDRDHERINVGWNHENDTADQELGRELDAALAKYAAVEPRAGLEERVLANLRAERAQVSDRGRWRWSAVAAIAAVVVIALALAWRSAKPSHPEVANHHSSTRQGSREPQKQLVSNGGNNRSRPQTPDAARKRIRRASPLVVAAAPKLDQFPSPQPLSEQEKILANYVAEYPEHAVLLARARTEALRRDQLEEMKAAPSDDQTTDPEERNNDTTER